MITAHTPETLAAFTQRVAAAFNEGRIRAPVHLHGGNEQQLLDVFQDVGPDDWICSSWRSHYHCLLKGVPEDELFAAILAGRSITLTFPAYKIVTSAIVGGILPIAVGLAHAIQRRGGEERVHCFLGDMTACTGLAHECRNYAGGHDLPIRFIVENNEKSVKTPTLDVWGTLLAPLHCFDYEPAWPHSGTGKRVEFW